MSGLSFDITLNDQLSGPAGAMDSSLGSLESQLRGLAAPLKSIDAGMASLDRVTRALTMAQASSNMEMSAQLTLLNKLTGDHLQLQRSLVNEAKAERSLAEERHRAAQQAQEDMRSIEAALKGMQRTSSGGGGGNGWGMLGTLASGNISGFLGELHPALAVATQFANTLYNVGNGALSATAGIMKFGFEQASWKQMTMRSLEVTLHSRTEAENFYKVLNKIADVTPFDITDVVPQGQALLAAGLTQKETESVLYGASDLVSLSGGRGSLPQVITELTRILATDKVTAPELGVLAGNTNGIVGPRSMIDALSTSRGISTEAARALLEHHGIGGREAVSLMLDLAEKAGGGPLGTASSEMGIKTLDGQLSTLESNLKRLFQDVALEPLTGFLGKINDLLATGSPLADEFTDRIKQFFEHTLEPYINRYSGEDGPKNLEKDLQDLFTTAETVAGALRDISRALVDISQKAAWLLGDSDPKTAIGASGGGFSNELGTKFDVARKLGVSPEDPQVAAAMAAAVEGLRSQESTRDWFRSLFGLSGAGDEFVSEQVARRQRREARQQALLERGDLPGLADGGLMTRPGVVAFAEDEPEIALPLSKVPSVIGAAMGGGWGPTIHAPVAVYLTVNGVSDETADGIRDQVRETAESTMRSGLEQLGLQLGAN